MLSLRTPAWVSVMMQILSVNWTVFFFPFFDRFSISFPMIDMPSVPFDGIPYMKGMSFTIYPRPYQIKSSANLPFSPRIDIDSVAEFRHFIYKIDHVVSFSKMSSIIASFKIVFKNKYAISGHRFRWKLLFPSLCCVSLFLRPASFRNQQWLYQLPRSRNYSCRYSSWACEVGPFPDAP